MVRTGRVPALEKEQLLQRARDLQPMLREKALETERLRRVPDDNVRAILESGLNRIAVPRRFGGLDVDFSLMHDVAFELGRACGATAWCYSLWGVHNWWVGYYPQGAQEEIYADGPDVLILYSWLQPPLEGRAGGGWLRGLRHWQFLKWLRSRELGNPPLLDATRTARDACAGFRLRNSAGYLVCFRNAGHWQQGRDRPRRVCAGASYAPGAVRPARPGSGR